jgi:hypothetical protein
MSLASDASLVEPGRAAQYLGTTRRVDGTLWSQQVGDSLYTESTVVQPGSAQGRPLAERRWAFPGEAEPYSIPCAGFAMDGSYLAEAEAECEVRGEPGRCDTHGWNSARTLEAPSRVSAY